MKKGWKLLLVLSIIFIPSIAYAWGPLTHVYLGNEILSLVSLLPAGIYKLLKKYRDDFLYGNLMADIILGKKFLPDSKNPHTWDVAFELFDSAEKPEQQAFVYGYMSHLAADTVAHEMYYKTELKGHAVFEFKSDSVVGRKYWLMAMSIDRGVKRRNDIFLESTLESPFFSVKTNKRLFKGMVFFSVFTPKRMSTFMDRRLPNLDIPDTATIKALHATSLERMFDILSKGECSTIIGKNPIYLK
ncbi:MAG: zinc dependent phospholipase C family protein [Nitrospirae bacterium]|nr:zinc dependent phospholipase C family protein [Nitrospirota bacterium]